MTEETAYYGCKDTPIPCGIVPSNWADVHHFTDSLLHLMLAGLADKSWSDLQKQHLHGWFHFISYMMP